MIYGSIQTIRDDASILTHWIQGAALPNKDDEDDRQQRVQLAVSRSLAFLGMAFGALWTLSLLTFVVTVPLKIFLKLTTAVGVYALGHDVFVMSQNANQQDFKDDIKTRLIGLFRGQEALEEERAQQFTHGTFLQPLWMRVYAN